MKFVKSIGGDNGREAIKRTSLKRTQQLCNIVHQFVVNFFISLSHHRVLIHWSISELSTHVLIHLFWYSVMQSLANDNKTDFWFNDNGRAYLLFQLHSFYVQKCMVSMQKTTLRRHKNVCISYDQWTYYWYSEKN